MLKSLLKDSRFPFKYIYRPLITSSNNDFGTFSKHYLFREPTNRFPSCEWLNEGPGPQVSQVEAAASIVDYEDIAFCANAYSPPVPR